MAVVIDGNSGITTPTSVFTDSSGNVGIGTSSPSVLLDVYGTGSVLGEFIRNNTGSASGGVTIGNNSGTFTIFADTAFSIYDNQAAASRAAITSTGLFQFNSGYGSVATAYGCRAWVNFNGTLASPITPRGSGNVTSVTKSGTGVYVVNFTSAMPDTNYATNVSTSDSNKPGINSGPTTGAIGVTGRNNGNTLTDLDPMCVSVFR